MFIFVKNKIKTFNPIKEDCKYAGQMTSPTTRNRKGELISKGSRKIKATKNKSNIWHYTAGHSKSTLDKIAHQHPAIFPERLARDHILSWSNEGDLVYDPLCGSGTTLKMAKKYNRNYIGSEISSKYCLIAQQRLDDLESLFEAV